MERIPSFGGTIYYDVKHDGTQKDFQNDAESSTVSANQSVRYYFENPAQLWFRLINHEQIQQQYRDEVLVRNRHNDQLRDLIHFAYR